MTNNSIEPLNIGNTINTAFRLYRNRFQTYVFFAVRACLWSLLPLVLQLILSQLLYQTITPEQGSDIGLRLFLFPIQIFSAAKYLFNNAVISRLAFQDIIYQPETAGQAEKKVKPKMWRLWWMQVLIGLLGAAIILPITLSLVLVSFIPILGVLLILPAFFCLPFFFLWLSARICIAELSKLLEVYDAERRISPTIRKVTTAIEGEALAADFIHALARRLPILVETTVDKSVQSSHTGLLLEDLVGIAHIAHITSIDAVDSFNAYCNGKVLDKNYVTILWPHPAQPMTFHTVTPNREQIENPILEAAALQPDIPTQAPPRFSTSRPAQSVLPTPTPVVAQATTDLTPVVEQLKRTVNEHQLHIEQLDDALEEVEAERDEFAELLEEKEVEAEELSTEVALLRGRLAELTVLTVDLDAELARARPDRVLRTVLDAVNRARSECKHLEFLPSAFTTANELQGPNPRQVLQDLKALDNAVANWRRDVFPIAGLQSYLRDSAGLDFAPRISEDTHHRHGEWYSALHKNKQIHIGAHLRRGKNRTLIRIYMHVDTAEKSIVIAKIVRHGPDSTS